MRSRYILIAVVLVAVVVFAGNQDPTNPPGSTSSYTLEDIYNRLNAGVDGSQSTFTEPAAGPGTPTMHTLNDIMGVAPAADDANGATTADVLSGKTFWGLTSGEWGQKTGTLSAGGSVCNGTMYSDGVDFFGARWCDQGDGTVLDMTTGLVWLENANYLGGVMNWDDAIMRPLTEIRDNGTNLTDGSVWGDWRLPTKDELNGITEGDERILSGKPGPFDNVQFTHYWSSTTDATDTNYAWVVHMGYGDVSYANKTSDDRYVWPVRAGR